MFRRWNRRVVALALVAVATCGLTSFGRADVVQKFTQDHPLDRGGALVLRNVNGAIEIRSWDRPEVRIEVEKRARTAEEMELIDLTIDPKPKRIAVQVKLPQRRTGWFRRGSTIRAEVLFTVLVPAEIGLVDVAGVNSGIAIDGVRGEVRASTVNGAIRAGGLESDAKLTTVNGAIEARFAALSANRQLEFSTVNGSVETMLPADAGAALRASSVNGRIQCDFPLTLSGKIDQRDLRATIGEGGATIRASTVNGGIRIRSALESLPR
jgi:hypothetical protein